MFKKRLAVLPLALLLPAGCASLYGVSDLPTGEAGVDGGAYATTSPHKDAAPDVVSRDAREAAADTAVAESSAREASPDVKTSDAPAEAAPADAGHHDAEADAHRGDGEADAHVSDAPADVVSDAPTADAPADVVSDAPTADAPADVVSDAPTADAPTDAASDSAADTAADAPTVSVDVTPSPYVWLPQGKSVAIQVTLSSPVTAQTQLQAMSLPTGVTAAPVEIAAGRSSGSLTLVATSSASEGVVSPTVQAGSAHGTFELVVAGSTGTLDTSFNSSGVLNVTPPGGSSSSTATFVAVLPDGSLVVAGSGWAPVKLLADGTVDPAFDTNLADSTKGALMPTSGTLSGVAVIPTTGQIALAGTDSSSGSTNLAVMVLNSDGSRDEALTANGLFERGPNDELFVASVTGVAASSAGVIAIVGNTSRSPSTGFFFALSGGGFNTVGQTDGFPSNNAVTCVAADIDGSFIVGGEAPAGGGQFYAAKVTVTTPSAPSVGAPGDYGVASEYLTTGAIAIDPSGDFFLLGTDTEGPDPPALTAVSSSGAVTVPNGYALPGPNISEGTSGFVGAASDEVNRVYGVGYYYDQAGYYGMVERLDQTGALDSTFGTAGSGLQTQWGGNTTTSITYNGIALDAVGRLVIVGNVSAGFFITRLWP